MNKYMAKDSRFSLVFSHSDHILSDFLFIFLPCMWGDRRLGCWHTGTFDLKTTSQHPPKNLTSRRLAFKSEGRKWGVRTVVVAFGVFGAPRFSVQRSPNTYLKGFWDLWTENRGAPKTPNATTTDLNPICGPLIKKLLIKNPYLDWTGSTHPLLILGRT